MSTNALFLIVGNKISVYRSDCLFVCPSVCLFVCPRGDMWNHVIDPPIFGHCPWPWFGSSPAALRTCDTFCTSGLRPSSRRRARRQDESRSAGTVSEVCIRLPSFLDSFPFFVFRAPVSAAFFCLCVLLAHYFFVLLLSLLFVYLRNEQI